jgi:cytoskeletal protein CcmA (bactofilin family)
MIGKKTWLAWSAGMALAFVLVAPVTATAMTIRQGDTVSIPGGETIADDVYAFGNTVTIDGTVDGDVVAFGQVVVISGQVGGSVIAAAQTVRIDGTVDGSVRAAGQMVDVSGQVAGDVLAGANQVGIGGTVNRDLVAGAKNVGITGMVGRNVLVAGDTLVIDGDVGGNVQAQSTQVTVGSTGSVGGNLEYWSAQPAVVQGDVSGATSRHEPQKNQRDGGGASGIASGILAAIIAWVQSFVGVVILGLLLVLLPRGPLQSGSQAALNRPWVSLGVGALVFFATPMVGVFVFGFGLFIGAWWLAFVLLAAYWLLLLLGVITGSLAIGRFLLRHASNGGEPILVWSLLLGLVLVWLVGAVPLLGAVAGWVVMTVGAGALVLAWMGKGDRVVVAAPAAPVMPPAQPPVA